MFKLIKAIACFSVLVGSCIKEHFVLAQNLPVQDVWSHSGLRDSIHVYDFTLNLLDFGADPLGIISSDDAFLDAMAASGQRPFTLYIPAGNYLFKMPWVLRDSMVIRGAGADSTIIHMDLGGRISDAIQIRGLRKNVVFTLQSTERGSVRTLIADTLTVAPEPGKWYFLQYTDDDRMYSTWAYGLGGALYQLSNRNADTLSWHLPFRISLNSSLNPRMSEVKPIEGVGLECFQLIRTDATPNQTSNIVLERAVGCWVIGVHSRLCNFGHVDIRQSAHSLIRGCYFEEAHAYGGGGQGYGVVLQGGSSMCSIENNIFRRLRHSVLLQSGANGNVVGYNYSREPFWSSVPSNAAGDLVCHGNYPYLNLFEGNIAQNIVVDASHGMNGPNNVFFRNRADTYGIFMSAGSGTDSTHFIANEVTSTSFLQGLYTLIGRGNFEWGNWVKGNIRPSGTGTWPISSYYLNSAPGYWTGDSWPLIGIFDVNNSQRLPALDRYLQGMYTDCRIKPFRDTTSTASFNNDLNKDWSVYPNPLSGALYIQGTAEYNGFWEIYSIHGRKISRGKVHSDGFCLDVSAFPSGAYFFCLSGSCRKVIKTP